MNWTEINQFLVKEHVGLFKAANNYDIYDLASGDQVLECREEELGFITKLLRFTDYKRFTPFEIQIRDSSGKLVLTISRGISIFLSTVEVRDSRDLLLGSFRQRLFSIGGKFDVRDRSEKVLCSLSGSWTGWDFRFLNGQRELAQVSKQWAGIGKELFTTADNYALIINPSVPADAPLRKLILAAVMCIDMVLKE